MGNVTSRDILFSKLPDEIVIKILSYLSLNERLHILPRVNSRIRRHSYESISEINFKKLREIKSPLEALKTIGRCARLCHVNFSQKDPNSILIAIYALKNCPLLEGLTKIYCNEKSSADFLKAIEKHGQSLKVISVDGLSLKTLKAGQLKKLTQIGLSSCTGLTDTVMKDIGSHCPNLESLILQDVTKSELTDAGMTFLLEFAKGSIMELTFPGDAMTESTYTALGQCQKLEYLCINNANGLKRQGLETIVQLPKLKDLALTFVEFQLKGEDIVKAFNIGRKSDKLESLRLEGLDCLDDAGLGAIAQYCTALIKINLTNKVISLITDVGMKSLVENCERLKKIWLQRIDNVTEAAFVDVKKLLPSLKMLDFLLCHGIQSNFMKELAREGVSCHCNNIEVCIKPEQT